MAGVAASDNEPMCDHICLRDAGHVDRGEPHFYGYEIPSPRKPMKLYGYVCPECKTWAEDMTPHCFNGHADDPVATLPFHVSAEPVGSIVPADSTPEQAKCSCDFDPSYTGGICDTCGLPDPTRYWSCPMCNLRFADAERCPSCGNKGIVEGDAPTDSAPIRRYPPGYDVQVWPDCDVRQGDTETNRTTAAEVPPTT